MSFRLWWLMIKKEFLLSNEIFGEDENITLFLSSTLNELENDLCVILGVHAETASHPLSYKGGCRLKPQCLPGPGISMVLGGCCSLWAKLLPVGQLCIRPSLRQAIRHTPAYLPYTFYKTASST